MVFNTVKLKVSETEALPSLQETDIAIVPTSELVGVPENVLDAGSNENQTGKFEPFDSFAV